MKILFITNIPSPYRVDFFNELGKCCELTVAFERVRAKDRDSRWQSDTFHGFEPVFLKGIALGTDASIGFQVVSVIKRGFDLVILGGYSSPVYFIAMEYMKMRGIPFVLNADGGFVKQDRQLIYTLKHYMISLPSAWLSTGELTDVYLKHYGAASDRIYRYPFTSVREKDCYLASKEEKIQKKHLLHIKEKQVIITVGQFIHRKGLDLLIQCGRWLHTDIGIYIIGGECGEEYHRLLKAEWGGRIHFEGFKSRDELREYYIAADIFAFPTREDIWGLVLNEAMAFGLPSVASKMAIASNELIEQGSNGFLVNPEHVEQMAERLNWLAYHDDERIKMGREAYEKAKDYTIEKMAQRHMEIFEELINRRGDW